MRLWLLASILSGVLGMASAGHAQGASDVFAEAQIARLPTTYAWAVDAQDIDTLMSIFSDDVEYDLSAYGIPNAKGKEEVRNIFVHGVFPINECSFIDISSIWSKVDGNSAIGGDYFVHTGINPVTDPPLPPNTRRQTQGRHSYRFKKVRGEWKISYLAGEPFVQKTEPFDPALLFNCPLAPGK